MCNKESNIIGASLGLKEKLQMPVLFKVMDSLVFVKDIGGNTFIDIYNFEKKQIINKIGMKGKGNGELLSVSSMEIVNKSNDFWLFDITLSKFHRFDLNDICIEKKRFPNQNINFDEELRGIINPMFIDDTLIVGTSVYSDNRLTYANIKGNYLFAKSKLPIIQEKVPKEILAQAYITKSVYSKFNEKIVLVNRYADMIEIYNKSGDLFKLIRGPYVYEPKFEVAKYDNSLVFAQRDEMRFGYIDVTCSDDKIYALFSGRTRPDFPGKANKGNLIYVFSWNGELLYKLKLDRDLLDIEYVSGRNSIFGLDVEHYPEIYEYSEI